MIEPNATEISIKLRDIHKAVAEAYIGPAKYNAAEAAKICGIPAPVANRYLQQAHVQAYIARLRNEWRVKAKAASKDVIEELLAVGTSDITDIIKLKPDGTVMVTDFASLNKHARKAIKKVKLSRRQMQGYDRGQFEEILEIELHDKTPALRILAKDVLGIGQGDPRDSMNQGDGKGFGGLILRGPKTQEKKDDLSFLDMMNGEEQEGPEEGFGTDGLDPDNGKERDKMGVLRSILPTETYDIGNEQVWD